SRGRPSRSPGGSSGGGPATGTTDRRIRRPSARVPIFRGMAGARRPAETTSPRDDLLGLYGPGSEAWALNREAMLLLGAGPRALLLQLAHPGVAAGVADHSDCRADPWARLQGTLRSYLRIVYGTGTAARSEIRRL